MQIDLGSRDVEFIEMIASIRRELLEIVHVPAGLTTHTAVLLQGPGSYAVEAVLANYIGNTNNVKV
jgi:aspartate aminotransferase-like enzyme